MIKKTTVFAWRWLQKKTLWWFTTLFGRIGVLFVLAALVLVLFTYYITDWGYTGRDNVLDAHDAYLYNNLVNSWGTPPRLHALEKELNNLKLKGTVFIADSDTLCSNDTLVYWSNHPSPIELCNYFSYSSTEDYAVSHNIKYNNYVSFGDINLNKKRLQATFVEKNGFKYLITLDVPPVPTPTFIPFVVVAFISLYILYQMIRRFLKPISLLQKRIIDLEKGDLDSKVKIIGNDELAVLSKNFNEMVEEIKDLLKQKERLLSDVSHELRTPLSKIRLLVAMLKPKEKFDLLYGSFQKNEINPKIISQSNHIILDTNEKLQKIDKNILYLDSIITNILLSDQMSSPYTNLRIESCSVSTLIKQATDLTFVKGVDIISDKGLDHMLLNVDRVKIAIAIKNLLENAHKYAEKIEKIRIYLMQEKGFFNITIKDRGPGLKPSLLKTITKRYVRGNHKKKEGVGLGLSICYKVMRAHGGKLKIMNNPKGGASFTLKIPHKGLDSLKE
jgi:signal transduction histidine kinase